MKQQKSLFESFPTEVPTTEGIKYAGSKLKIIPYILQLAEIVGVKTVLDGFSGTTRVSQAFAKQGYSVVCNDIAVWSEIFGKCYLLNQREHKYYSSLIDHLNNLSPFDGWFTKHYGGQYNGGCAIQSDGSKKPWQVHNTRKLDAIREEIESLNLSSIDKAVALTSLILALDRVDSSLGHYVSYLKEWSPRSCSDLALRVPKIFLSEAEHQVFKCNIFDILGNLSVDLAYYDPPYGSNNEKMPPSRVRYASYYHIWKSIILFDKPDLFGKANRRTDTSDRISASDFEEFRRGSNGHYIAVESIEKLIRNTNANYIILSYSSGGRATASELNDVIQCNGKLLNTVEIDYKKNVMAGMKWTNEWLSESNQSNKEYLFLLEK